ncbi:hypothetical protein PTSG_09337 [Salpingoeca rosetta]|uniref:VWFA domain-containing protein n=1 Tax=Salpingoeca rosetta (strain ATCC 50818 / BSB-021) TaxID=946362 RepID=F2UMC4_SALR5|nr:uncharacterized protein PTSG_09337 [Salpingoeca rosetta]EGD78273.1 hypothetical protein PTSG_09337 [Salpingoeca rosetta]|eukprot:XP_004989596.1 hypothetical protein PTSG_09337 [Salpingoeca rosetta]
MMSSSSTSGSVGLVRFHEAECRFVRVEDNKLQTIVNLSMQEMLSGSKAKRHAKTQANTRVLVIADNSYSMSDSMNALNSGICDIYRTCCEAKLGAFHLVYFNDKLEEMDLTEAEGIDAVCDKIMHAGPNGCTDFDIVVDRLAREIDAAMEVSTAKPDEQHQLYLVVMTDGVASMPSDDRFQALSSAVEKFNSASKIGNECCKFMVMVLLLETSNKDVG